MFFSWWCSWCWLLGVIWGFLKIWVPKPLVFPFVLLRKRNLLFVPPSGFWADDDWYDLQMERRLPLTRDVLRDLALAQRRWYPDTPKSYDSYWLIITIHPKEWLLFRVTGTFGPQTGIGGSGFQKLTAKHWCVWKGGGQMAISIRTMVDFWVAYFQTGSKVYPLIIDCWSQSQLLLFYITSSILCRP